MLTAAALGLVGGLAWLLVDTKPSVPLVIAVIEDYPETIGPLLLAREDKQAILSLDKNRSPLSRGTVAPEDLSDDLSNEETGGFKEALLTKISTLRSGGPGNATAIAFIACAGAVGDKGEPCLIPGGAIDKVDRWVSVRDLLDDLNNLETRPRHLVLVLDACRMEHAVAWGILDGGFAAAVRTLTPPPGISLFVAAGPGETSCADIAEQTSVFAATFIDGVEGCSDKNNDGRVTVAELAEYLETEGAKRARISHGRRQTPFALFPEDDPSGEAGVSWNIRQTPRKWQRTDDSTRKPTVGWLARRWGDADKLKNVAIERRPKLWAQLQHDLLLSERYAIASLDPPARLEERIASIVDTLEQPIVTPKGLPAMRLAQLAEWGGKSDEREAARFDSNKQPDNAQWREYLKIEKPTAPAPWPIELYPAWLLVSNGAPEAWDDPVRRETLNMVLRLSFDAVKAAYPPDVRADHHVADAPNNKRQQADTHRREAFDLAVPGDTDGLKKAKDLAEKATETYKSISTIGQNYSDAWQLLDRVRAELPWLAHWSAVHAGIAQEPQPPKGDINSLLGLVEHLENVITDTSYPDDLEEKLEQLHAEIEKFWGDYRDAGDGTADNQTKLAELNGQLTAPLTLGGPRTDLHKQIAESASSLTASASEGSPSQEPNSHDFPSDAWARRHAWIEKPGSESMPATAWLHPVARVLLTDDQGAALHDGSWNEVAKAYGRWGSALRKKREEARKHVDIDANVNRQPDLAKEDLAKEDLAARSIAVLSIAALRIAALRSEEPDRRASAESWPQLHAAACWHARLLRAANESIDEFFGGPTDEEGAAWYRVAANNCIDAAKKLLEDNPNLNDRLISDRDPKTRLEGIPEDWWDVSVQSPSSAPERTQTPEFITHLSIAPEAKEDQARNPGRATMWVVNEAESLRRDDDARRKAVTITTINGENAETAVSIPFPWNATATDQAWQVAESNRLDTSELRAVTWFRGHRQECSLGGGTRITWTRPTTPPEITVASNDAKRSRYVTFILDCSDSMKINQKMRFATDALSKVMESLSEAQHWHASAWLYGHRARYNNAVERVVEKSHYASKNAIQTDLHPDEDVECVIEMKSVDAGYMRELPSETLRGWGQTPLYFAIQRALEEDKEKIPPHAAWKLVVLTDGANNVFDPEKQKELPKLNDVSKALSDVNESRPLDARVTIDIVAFDVELAELSDFKAAVKDWEGQWIDETNGQQLVKAYGEFLGLERWEVLDGKTSLGDKEVGGVWRAPQHMELPHGVAVQLKGKPQTRVNVRLEAGQEVDLIADGQKSLQPKRFEPSDECDRQERLQSGGPENSGVTWSAIASFARRARGGKATFPITLFQQSKNNDITPRPYEFWAEVRLHAPAAQRLSKRWTFSEPVFKPSEPVPVVELTVPNWPKAHQEAEIRLWFSPERIDPDRVVQLKDLQQPDPLKSITLGPIRYDLTFDDKITSDYALVTVQERHDSSLSPDQLPAVRVRIERRMSFQADFDRSPCEQVEHAVDEKAQTSTSRFWIKLDDGKVPDGLQLTFIRVEELKKRCISLEDRDGETKPLIVAMSN